MTCNPTWPRRTSLGISFKSILDWSFKKKVLLWDKTHDRLCFYLIFLSDWVLLMGGGFLFLFFVLFGVICIFPVYFGAF